MSNFYLNIKIKFEIGTDARKLRKMYVYELVENMNTLILLETEIIHVEVKSSQGT